MTLVKVNPFFGFQSIEALLDRAFKNFPDLKDIIGEDFFTRGAYPRLDVKKYSDSAMITFELPSWAKKEDVKIELTDNVLTISGPGKQKENFETNIEPGEIIYSEIKTSAFKRSVTVPKEYDLSQASAKFEDGRVSITIPLAEYKKRKTLKIE
jgi:HSP20 family protein